jgi:tetratricopeptide (TPR) repeat protein
MEKVIKVVEKYVLLASIAVLPVFVLLNSSAPALTPKLELLVVAGSLAAILWVVRMFLKGEVSFAPGKYDLGVLLTAVAFLASTILRTPNKMEAFLVPGVTSFLLAAAFFYFLVNQLGKKGKAEAVAALIISGLLLSLSMIFAGLGVFAKIPQLPAFLKDPLFNPMGGLVPVGIYLIPLAFLGVSLVVKDKDIIKKVFWGASTVIIIMALAIVVNSSLPGKPQFPKFPNLQTSWEVAVGTVAKSPVFGAGPGNYISAFNQFRPVSYNQTDLWSVRFTTANNFYLTLVTEAGLLGLAAFLIILLLVYRSFREDPKLEKLSLIALILILAVFPASPVIFVPLFVLLAIFSGSEDKVVTLTTVSVGAGNKVPSRALSIVIGLLILAGVGAVDFFGAKVMISESTYAKSLTALGRNDFKGTFDLIQKAITQNPKVDRYHASLAQLDMALAQSLASKKDVTDSDKTTITQLVQQAINESKKAVGLNPGSAGNWEVLAQIYRTIMPFAQGADQFAVQTYTQAVALDPTNPNLRISLGGVYYALGRYDDAIEAFKLAVLAKPDLANAHYNLAIAYREKKNFDSAINEMNTVLSLVAKDSQDYTLAKNTLDELEKNKPAAKTTGTESLTPPEKTETSNIKPPITLPVDSTPPTPNP